jgi:DNA-binding transcriptional regulator GbsR (MarR family)
MVSSSRNAAEKFIEQMGRMMQADGGPRIAGRIFGLLLIENRAMSLQDIAVALGASRASASTNARLLASSGLVRLVSRPGDRQDYYEIVDDPFQRMLESVGAKMHRVAAQIAETELLFAHDDPAKPRVRQLAERHRQSAEFIEQWAASLIAPAPLLRKSERKSAR